MVDQNSNPQQPPSAAKPEASHGAAQGMSAPTVVKAGEMMLIFALVLIFLVCFAVAVHLYLRRKRRRRGGKPKPKGKKKAKNKRRSNSPRQPELQSQERKVAELVGTPICEMGESEPRHEMEDVEVHERYTMMDPERPEEAHIVSPLDPDLEAGTMGYDDIVVYTPAGPEARELAVYWARGL